MQKIIPKFIFLVVLMFSVCLFAQAQDRCHETIETYTVLLLKMPLPSADNSKEANLELQTRRKEIKQIWKPLIKKECAFKEARWFETIIKLLPLLALLK